ncbi:MAG: hypothetical protein V7631_2486 [Massilia sp.]|jgi:hypothetical protein
MWNADQQRPRAFRALPTKQRGVAAVEFALLVLIFFALVFGVLEIARLIYLFNTLQEVTRRAAVIAMNSPFDQSAQDTVRRQALFRDSNGDLVLGAPVTFEHLRLEYLSLSRGDGGPLVLQPVSPLPPSPAANRFNCLADPYGANCIRYIRVQVCQPGSSGNCDRVPYRTLFPLIDLSLVGLPRAQTFVPAQSLGYTAGETPEL